MKTPIKSHRRTRVVRTLSAFVFLLICSNHPEAFSGTPSVNETKEISSTTEKKKIKIALLLDTSNSMDGLIEQAKSQLWKFVNALSGATFQGEKPILEIALYEYGNDGLPSSEGYIRQVSIFTSDLDLISEKLFSLSTNGGNEFCGQVIQTSLNQLDWKGDASDLRIIFIAGNEPFTQGKISPSFACGNAKEKDVFVNTIHCGSFDQGIAQGWQQGASLTGGNYMSIEQDRQTVYIASPYDDEISTLNDQLNKTYISYGAKGEYKKENQIRQDNNASGYGKANKADRAISKTSSFYSNAEWDLVDASKEKSFDISTIKEEELPAELKGKTIEERRIYVVKKTNEREIIKKKIVELNSTRIVFISEIQKNQPGNNSLDDAMLKAITVQASKKGFVFK